MWIRLDMAVFLWELYQKSSTACVLMYRYLFSKAAHATPPSTDLRRRQTLSLWILRSINELWCCYDVGYCWHVLLLTLHLLSAIWFITVCQGSMYHPSWSYIRCHDQQVEAICSQFSCVSSWRGRRLSDETLVAGHLKKRTRKGSSKHRWVQLLD